MFGRRHNQIEGLDRLVRDFRRLGQVPQKVANKSARAGAAIARKAAKGNAPVDTGQLKKNIVMRVEKSRAVRVGKKVYGIMINSKKTDLFAKFSKTGKRSYYPASQEYGWKIKGVRKHGKHYLERALVGNYRNIQKEIVQVAGQEVDKILRG
jgi:HK97 gp10 family phage protein